jgi:Mg2+ and Co2+ transporter CorA
MEFLNEYDFDIKHIKGKENKVVDALNKRVHEMHDTTINMYCSDLKSRILEVVASDQHYVQVTKGLQQENVSLKFEDYRLEEDRNLLFGEKF